MFGIKKGGDIVFCKNCGEPLQDGWVTCPKCSQPITEKPIGIIPSKSQPSTEKAIATVISIVLIVGLFFWIDSGFNKVSTSFTQNSSKIEGERAIERSGLMVIKSWSENGMTKGEVKNTTDKTYRYAEVTVKYYSTDGKLIETKIANNTNVGAGETWVFSVYQPRVEGTFKIDGVTGKWAQ